MVAGWAAAARRASSDATILTPAEALEQAFELWDLNPALFDEPPDAVRIREVEQVRAMWRLLRTRCGHR